MTLVYSNNLRLTFGCLIRFENIQSDLIARCRNGRKTLNKSLEIGLIWKLQFLKHVRFRHSFLYHLKVHNKSEIPENLNTISHRV